MSRPPERIAVVGGGIAGLAAAHYCQEQSRTPVELTVFEAGRRWGGKIVTRREAGFVVEGGPDTFVSTKPAAIELCRRLGLEDRLRGTHPERRATYILRRDRLHEIPGGLTMMIPTDPRPMLRTRLLSWPEKLRLALEPLIPAGNGRSDESMASFFSRRLGRGAYDALVEPLLSGIYAGDGEQLSLPATFPEIARLETDSGGLVRGALALRRRRASRPAVSHPQIPRSLFLTTEGGLGEIVDTLVDVLRAGGTHLRLATAVEGVERQGQGYRLQLSGGDSLLVDGLILAAPAFASADLLSALDNDLAAELRSIDYVSTATVSLAYDDPELARRLDGYGYVIPRREGRQALACTWTSTKFPHRAPTGAALVRVFIGRAGQQVDWSDDNLERLAREELRLTLGLTRPPAHSWVFCWDRAMPQYNVGHLERLEKIDARVRSHRGLALAGNAYRGIGLPDCIRSGELAAERVLQTER
jgi:protoporphyrinogen/coproporphyrinogen III oxidase